MQLNKLSVIEQTAKYIWENRNAKPKRYFAIFVHDKNDALYYRSWFTDCFRSKREGGISDIEFLNQLGIVLVNTPGQLGKINLCGLMISETWSAIPKTKELNEKYFSVIRSAIMSMKIHCPACSYMVTDDTPDVHLWRENHKLPEMNKIEDILKKEKRK